MGQVWVWGKGRKDKRGRGLDAGRWTWKGLPWKDCTLLGKVEQTRSESQTPGGGEDTAARPEPGLPASECLPGNGAHPWVWWPIIGGRGRGEHVRDDGACIVGEGAPVRSGEHWK